MSAATDRRHFFRLPVSFNVAQASSNRKSAGASIENANDALTAKPSSEPTRIEILEPLRGLAAMSVAWYHFTNGGPLLEPGSWLWNSGHYGWLGVEVFFVISGFVIPYSLWRGGYTVRRDFGLFVLKRVIRLDPPYLAAIVVALALAYASARAPGFAGNAPEFSAPQILAHLGYANAFLGYPWLVPVFWTLAIEFQYYLFMALAFPLFANRLPLVRLAAVAGFAAAGFAISLDMFVFRYGALFALGILAFQRMAGIWSSGAFVLLEFAAGSAVWFILGPLTAVVGVLTAFVIAFVRLPANAPLGPLRFLGKVSYSLYLLHVPIGGRVVNLGARIAKSTPTQFLVLAAAVAASLGAAYLLYRFVERPAQRWSARWRYAANKP